MKLTFSIACRESCRAFVVGANFEEQIRMRVRSSLWNHHFKKRDFSVGLCAQPNVDKIEKFSLCSPLPNKVFQSHPHELNKSSRCIITPLKIATMPLSYHRQLPPNLLMTIYQSNSTDSTIDVEASSNTKHYRTPHMAKQCINDVPPSPSSLPMRRVKVVGGIFRSRQQSPAASSPSSKHFQECHWEIRRCNAFDEEDTVDDYWMG